MNIKTLPKQKGLDKKFNFMFVKITKTEFKRSAKIILHDLSIIVVSVSIVYFAFIAYAGNLLPPEIGTASSTMRSLDEIYNTLAGTPDLSAVTPREDGNAMDILKCITTKMNGGSCS
jgi:hypothetical protein